METKVTYYGRYYACSKDQRKRRQKRVEFVEWNNNGLVLIYPKGNGVVTGSKWFIPYSVLGMMIRTGFLKIEGYIPEPAIKEINSIS